MQTLKNIVVGFLVSFVGSIPLGYLNVFGFEIYTTKGISSTILYLLGVVVVEFFVIYLTLIFANRLAKNEKLTKYIQGFSVLFMVALAAVFYFGSNSESQNAGVLKTIGNNYFFTGLFLSCLNFIQIPFWTGWNLYLLNGNYIEISKSRKYFYVLGTVVGTFCGMIVLILSLYYFTKNVDFLSKYLMQIIIPLVFLGLGFFQAVKFYGKYYR